MKQLFYSEMQAFLLNIMDSILFEATFLFWDVLIQSLMLGSSFFSNNCQRVPSRLRIYSTHKENH